MASPLNGYLAELGTPGAYPQAIGGTFTVAYEPTYGDAYPPAYPVAYPAPFLSAELGEQRAAVLETLESLEWVARRVEDVFFWLDEPHSINLPFGPWLSSPPFLSWFAGLESPCSPPQNSFLQTIELCFRFRKVQEHVRELILVYRQRFRILCNKMRSRLRAARAVRRVAFAVIQSPFLILHGFGRPPRFEQAGVVAGLSH
jgi:hypothetical protein